MKFETALVREPGEHSIPRELAVPTEKPRGKPRTDYDLFVRSERDVEFWRRRGLPLVLLTSEWVTQNGYPEKFRPLLFTVAAVARKLKESKFRVVPVKDTEALRNPKFEEFVTFLLKVDTLAAHAVVHRNVERLNRAELYRRVRNEGLERLATKARLFEFVPDLPRVGEPLSKEDLEWVERNAPARPVRA